MFYASVITLDALEVVAASLPDDDPSAPWRGGERDSRSKRKRYHSGNHSSSCQCAGPLLNEQDYRTGAFARHITLEPESHNTSPGTYVSACLPAYVSSIHSNPNTTLLPSTLSTHHLSFCVLTKFAAPFAIGRVVLVVLLSFVQQSNLYHQAYSKIITIAL